MKRKNTLTFINSRTRNSHLKLSLSLILIFIILGSIVFYEVFSYKILMKNFITKFDMNNFSSANNLLLTKEKFNPIKSIFIEDDLSKYFLSKVNETSDKITKGELTQSDALVILTEIRRYNILTSNIDNTITAFSKSDAYNSSLDLYNSGNFEDAYDGFLSIKPSDSNYNNAISYLNKCKYNLKSNLINKIKSLCEKNYYTKALEEIDKLNNILGDDSEIKTKINQIENDRSEYLLSENERIQAASSSVINNISTSNINKLSIESITDYLLLVDLNSQKTYIYKGNKDNWKLNQTFTCSTGIKNEETPKGVYTIKEKGTWFYSDKYQQGGKYWVQFMGDYLFHSLPYNKDQSKIVDFTLGKPSSHGCIRLEESSSKWIYDNVPSGSKLIIK